MKAGVAFKPHTLQYTYLEDIISDIDFGMCDECKSSFGDKNLLRIHFTKSSSSKKLITEKTQGFY